MGYYALFYDVVEDYVKRRAPVRPEHLRVAGEAHARGELLMGGVLEEPTDQALLVFRAEDRSTVERFAENDPYVRANLVTGWTVRPWALGIGGEEPVVAEPPTDR